MPVIKDIVFVIRLMEEEQWFIELGEKPSDVAITWILKNKAINSVILSFRNCLSAGRQYKGIKH